MGAHPCIIPWSEARAHRHERGFMLPFVNETCGAQHLRMHVSVINPGAAAHPPHRHADEEIIYILEGRAVVLLGETEHAVGEQTAVFCASQLWHGLRNAGDEPLKYMIIREGEPPRVAEGKTQIQG